VKWKSGASIDDGTGSNTVYYPNTPFGYSYTPPEEGYIAQSSASGQAKITMTCCPSTCQIVESGVLNYSGTGWNGWSCPAGTVIVEGSIRAYVATNLLAAYDGLGFVAAEGQGVKWKSGASIDDGTGSNTIYYPDTPFGYSYTPPEEGYIAQSSASGQAKITMACCPSTD
jgi:hypothetical protein